MDDTLEKDASKMKIKNKEYYKNNLEKIKTKHKCDICRGSYTTYNKGKHVITKKHQKVLASQTQTESNN
jgi:hypothetical protein